VGLLQHGRDRDAAAGVGEEPPAGNSPVHLDRRLSRLIRRRKRRPRRPAPCRVVAGTLRVPSAGCGTRSVPATLPHVTAGPVRV
jgi:hypothetical protein